VEIINRIKTELTRFNLNRNGKATIKRTIVHSQGYSVTETDNFIKVVRGNEVEYFTNVENKHSPFWNLYRIVSKPENDFVIHEVKDGHQKKSNNGNCCGSCEMKAYIKPLQGKYYGTEIVIERALDEGVFTLWNVNPEGKPSIRETEKLDCNGDPAQCKRDAMWGKCEGYCEAIDSSHREDAGDYELAQFIVKQINEEFG